MANYTTSADLIDDILTRAGEPVDTSSDEYSNAVTFLNRAYQGIWSGGSEINPDIHEVWWWIRKDSQGVLTLRPVNDTGTVAVTNDSNAIVFSSAPATSMAGRHFKVNDHSDVFIISTHTAASVNATLESVYTGTTNGTASFKAMLFDYNLASDVLYLSAPMWGYQDSRRTVELLDLTTMKERWSVQNLNSGVPTNFAMLDDKKVRFSHFGGVTSTELIKVDYEYARIPADLEDDTAEPIVPRQYRKILADWALMLLLDKKEDTRAANAAGLASNGLKSMAKEHRRRILMGTDKFAKIEPRASYRQHLEGPLRTASGLIVG